MNTVARIVVYALLVLPGSVSAQIATRTTTIKKALPDLTNVFGSSTTSITIPVIDGGTVIVDAKWTSLKKNALTGLPIPVSVGLALTRGSPIAISIASAAATSNGTNRLEASVASGTRETWSLVVSYDSRELNGEVTVSYPDGLDLTNIMRAALDTPATQVPQDSLATFDPPETRDTLSIINTEFGNSLPHPDFVRGVVRYVAEVGNLMALTCGKYFEPALYRFSKNRRSPYFDDRLPGVQGKHINATWLPPTNAAWSDPQPDSAEFVFEITTITDPAKYPGTCKLPPLPKRGVTKTSQSKGLGLGPESDPEATHRASMQKERQLFAQVRVNILYPPGTKSDSVKSQPSECQGGCFEAVVTGDRNTTVNGRASVEIDVVDSETGGGDFNVVLRSREDEGHYLVFTRGNMGGRPRRPGAYALANACDEEGAENNKPDQFAAEYWVNAYNEGPSVRYGSKTGTLTIGEITNGRIIGDFNFTACHWKEDGTRVETRLRGKFNALWPR